MRKNTPDLGQLFHMSSVRSNTYDMIIGTFACLPDRSTTEIIRSDRYRQNLIEFQKLNEDLITKGVNSILQFLKNSASLSADDLTDAIAVDRTKLIRTAHTCGLKAPYENQYRETKGLSRFYLDLKAVYGTAGYQPKNCEDSVDFFCIELDFIRQLNLKITDRTMEVHSSFALQSQFMEEHLGRWLPEYCREARKIAETGYYEGWLLFLEGFLKLEENYLKSVCS